MKKFWKWKNQTVTNRETREQTLERTLFLDGTIAEEDWSDDDIIPKFFRDELFAGNGDTTTWINPPGGNCVVAAQTYNMMMEYPGNITVKIDGTAASAASAVAMAGTKALVSPAFMLMIHNPTIAATGNISETQRAIVMLAEAKESTINAYEIGTGISRARLSHLMDIETWMDVHTAIDMGFTDGILAKPAEMPVENNATDPTLFSRTVVTNSSVDKLVAKCRIKKSGTPECSVDSPMECLDLVKQYTQWRYSAMVTLGLHEKCNTVWNAAKAFLDSHRAEKGTLTAEDGATYSRMEQEIVDPGKGIARFERQEALEVELNRPINKPFAFRPGNSATDKPVKTDHAFDEYKNDMLQALRINFRQVPNILQEGVGADSGCFVPGEHDSRLTGILTEKNTMRSLGHTITASGEHKINIATTKLVVAWIEEGSALQLFDTTFSQISLDAYKLHVAIKVTEGLLYDNASGLEDCTIDQFGKALVSVEEDAFLNGDGSSRPIGLFATAGGGTVVGAFSVAAKSDDMLDLVYALKRPYRKDVSFIMDDKALAQPRKLRNNNGTYIWWPSYQSDEPGRVLGYAVHISAHAPENAIAFGDHSYRNIDDRDTYSSRQLTELFVGNGMVGYVAKERVDGRLIPPEAVQILKLSGSSKG